MKFVKNFKKKFENSKEKVCKVLFQVNPILLNNNQRRLSLIEDNNDNNDFFDYMIYHPNYTIPFLKLEISSGIIFNIIIFSLFVFNIFSKIYYYFQEDALLTVLLILISILNGLGILPKLLSYWKLNQLNNLNIIDRSVFSQGLWLFMNCRLFIVNSLLSKVLTFVNFTAAIRIWQLNFRNLFKSELLGLTYVLVFSFFLRLIISFIRQDFI